MDWAEKDTLSRRGFMQYGAGALAVLCLPLSKVLGKTKIPIALQLYSVRNECQKDFEKTVAAVAKMGYRGVEFAGYFDRTANQVKDMLNANGLKCAGTHIQLNALIGDELKKTVEFNRVIQNKFLIVPSLPEARRGTKQAWLETAKLFNELAEKVKPYGMQVGYHNHTAEFKPMDGEIPMELFAGNTNKDVITQLDIGWATAAGADPAAFLKKYPGRALTVHVKEYSSKNREAFIGEGEVNWNVVFQVCETAAGTEWYVVEDERRTLQLEGVETDLKNLKKMGK